MESDAGGSATAQNLLPILFDKAANSIGRLCALPDPVLDSVQLQCAVMPLIFRIVGPQNLEKFAITRAATIGHNYFIIGAILRAFSA